MKQIHRWLGSDGGWGGDSDARRMTVMAMKFDAGGFLSVLPVKVKACMAMADKCSDGGDSDEDGGYGDGDSDGDGDGVSQCRV